MEKTLGAAVLLQERIKDLFAECVVENARARSVDALSTVPHGRGSERGRKICSVGLYRLVADPQIFAKS